jgi:hypothetical protein
MNYNHILEIHAKEWFDRVNGNSYFSAKVYLDDKPVATLPFQYGYGDHYQDRTKHAIEPILKNMGIEFDDYDVLWRICSENDIKLVYSKQEKCLKREVVAHGGE